MPGTATDNVSTSSDELPMRDTVRACIATAEQLEQQGHHREAIQLYEKARGLDPKATNYARHLAGLYDLENDPAHSLAEFQTAIAASPNDADLLNDFGCFEDRRGNYAEAESILRKAVAASSQSDRTRINLAMTLAHQKRYKESFDLFSNVVGPAAAHSNLGVILAKQGQIDQAKRAFEQALALNPELPQPRTFLTVLDGKTGEAVPLAAKQ
jgi:Tfp pilus assembly protein PilF